MENILTLIHKEFLIEARNKQGFYTSLLFSLIAVISMSFASYGQTLNPTLASGMLFIVLLFSAVLTVPRVFISEQDSNTFDLIRTWTTPQTIFAGKLIFSFLQVLCTGVVLSILFTVFFEIQIKSYLFFFGSLFLGAASLSAASSLCSALALGATSRWLLSVVLSVPILLAPLAMCIGAMRVAFGVGSVQGGFENLLGLIGFVVAMLAIGLKLVGEVWALK